MIRCGATEEIAMKGFVPAVDQEVYHGPYVYRVEQVAASTSGEYGAILTRFGAKSFALCDDLRPVTADDTFRGAAYAGLPGMRKDL
jgi:hypothetical protein